MAPSDATPAEADAGRAARTVTSEPHVLALSRTNHPNDDVQMSHHMLITRHGRHVWLISDEKRAIDNGMPA